MNNQQALISSTNLGTNRKTLIAWLEIPKVVSAICFSLVGLFTVATYILQMRLGYPELTNEKAELVLPLFKQGGGLVLIALFLLALGGLLVTAVSVGLSKNLEKGKQKRIFLAGMIAGGALVLSNIGWLLVMPGLSANYSQEVMNSGVNQGYQFFHQFSLIVGGIIAIFVLSLWTLLIARLLFRKHRTLGLLGYIAAFGLQIGFLHALAWEFNLNVIIVNQSDFDLTDFLSDIYLVGQSLWLVWLIFVGVWLLRRPQFISASK